MDYLSLIDSIFEPIKKDEINGKSRFEILLYVFTKLNSIGFVMDDLDEKVMVHIAGKLKSKLINEHLDFLQDYFTLAEIREAAKTQLSHEPKVKVKPKVLIEPAPVTLQKVPENDDYNPESDVLEEEGLMEPPPVREMQYDLAFMKTLGITPDE